MRRIAVFVGAVVLAAAACAGSANGPFPFPSMSSAGERGLVDVGGYELDWWCEGSGSPTIVLEAGYDSGGTSTFFEFLPRVAEMSRVCTYDRAGTGTSDPRPSSMAPVTGEQIASELHAVLASIGVESPIVLVGHPYGGPLVRVHVAAYPDDVAAWSSSTPRASPRSRSTERSTRVRGSTPSGPASRSRCAARR